MKKLSLIGIKKSFGEQEILKNINLDINQGETLAILGISGAGKSTLLRIMAGLEIPDKGKVFIDRKLVTSGSNIIVPSHSRKLGFIFQNLGLWEHMSVEEHLAFVIMAQKQKHDQKKIEEVLEFLGLLAYREKKPFQLSGGEKQRLAIARALIQEPDFLLLDEPFSNLDIPRKRQLRKELSRIKNEKGLTFVYVTHDPLDIKLMSDRVAILHEGEIIQLGTYEELHTSPAQDIVEELLQYEA